MISRIRQVISPIMILLLINMTLESVVISMIFFSVVEGQKSRDHQSDVIVNQTYKKLDALNIQNQRVLEQQGNLSSDQRQKIINAFESLPDSGIGSHEDALKTHALLHDILGNLTKR